VLREMIERTLFSVCNDDTRFQLNGVFDLFRSRPRTPTAGSRCRAGPGERKRAVVGIAGRFARPGLPRHAARFRRRALAHLS
jgi:hypothetical protein